MSGRKLHALRKESMNERIGKYLEVELSNRQPRGGRTSRWRVIGNNGDCLGIVGWFARWRQYCFDPSNGTTFNRDCLIDIAAFLERINTDHRKKRNACVYDRQVRNGEIEP